MRKGEKQKAFSRAWALTLCASLIAGSLAVTDSMQVNAQTLTDVSQGDAAVSGGDVSGGMTDQMSLLRTVSGSNVYAYRTDGDYTQFTENEVVADLKFGVDIKSSQIYNDTDRYGFSDVEFNNEAPGWKNKVYYPRVASRQEPGASYVEDGDSYLAVLSKVWTEKESTGYGIYTYENTSTFDIDLANADYQVDMTFVNPTGSAYSAYVESEDITKKDKISVDAGGQKQVSFAAVVIDGCLNLKFLADSSASSEGAAAIQKVYVSNVKITRLATEEQADKPTVYLASDSTVQTYDAPFSPPQTGWGQVFAQFFGASYTEEPCKDCGYSQSRTYVADNAVVENRAIGGRSSKSFVEEGKLDDLLEDIKQGDYLLIQWGHNDATASRPNRYVSPDDFGNWLMYYINGALQRGAQPVLVTPVARYSYKTKADGSLDTFKCDFEAYRSVMMQISTQLGIPLIDLSQRSIAVCNLYGIEGAESLFLHIAPGEYPDSKYASGVTDDTHLQQFGAYKFAKCVAEGILESDSPALNDLKQKVVVAIPENAPGKIQNLKSVSESSVKIALQWDEDKDAELYYVYRAEVAEGEDPAKVDFTDAEKYSVASSNQFTDKNCKSGTTYVYAVRGFNDRGLGELSDHFTVTTKAVAYQFDFNYNSSPTMAGWTGVKQNEKYSASKGYGWITAPDNGRYRSGNGSADSSNMADDFCLGNGEFAVDVPNGDYEVTVYSGDLLAGTGKLTAVFAAEGREAGSVVSQVSLGSLTFPVRVEDGQLNISISGNSYWNGLTISDILAAPNGLVMSEADVTSDGKNITFLLTFNTVKNAVSYNVYRRNTMETEFSLVKSFTAKELEESPLDCQAMTGEVGETYEYYITCVMEDGSVSARSQILTANMFISGEPAAAPADVRCISPVPNETEMKEEITLEWCPVAGAVKYIVYRSNKSESSKGFTGYEKIGETREASYTDADGVTTNVHWYYKVAAVTATGIGAQSLECETPVTGSMVGVGREKYTDRAAVAINLAGSDGGEVQVSATDSQGNKLEKGVYLSWRSFEADLDENNKLTTSFTVYRNGEILVNNYKGTNLVDEGGNKEDVYRVVGSNDGDLGLKSLDTPVWAEKYLELSLSAPADEKMPDGSTCTYQANDMSVGDLDGDGQLELVVKWYPSNAQDNSKKGYTGKTFLDGYDVDFTTGKVSLLWRIDMGVNIRSGAHYTQFQVWDFDGDGMAEIAVKTADGTTTYHSQDGTAAGLKETGFVGKCNADALPTDKISSENDYRNSGGYVLSGPEYFTIFNGNDGTVVDTTDYIPERGSVSSWGDDYGGRVDRFLSAVAYLDGRTPFAVFARGYYTRTCLTAYYLKDTNGDGVGDALDVYWKFDTKESGSQYEGQGNHGLNVNDIDGDGKDEIIYGSLVIDNDGTVKYSTGLGHGDAMHVSDWVSWNDGLEIMSVHEDGKAKYHVEIHDAETGEILMGYNVGRDNGRGVAADIDPTSEGAEWWSIGSAEITYSKNPAWNATDGEVYSTWSTLGNLIKLADSTPASNFSIFWDGDLLSEIQDHTFDEGPYLPIGVVISKWNYEKEEQETLLYSEEIYSNNGTKGNMGLVADILGDWREEIITRTSADHNKVRIYSTTIQTDYVVPCLLTDLAYREAVAWQNVGYNQPANTSYLLSQGLVTARLSQNSVSYDSASIQFTPANDGDLFGHEVTGYEIYRSENGGEYELLDTVKESDLDRTEQSGKIILKNDFEDGASDFAAFEAGQDSITKDGASQNANTSQYVYNVFGSSSGGRAAVSSQLNADQEGVKVSMDFRLDAAARNGQETALALLPVIPKNRNWIDDADGQILKISGMASSSNKFKNITINGVDITSKAKASSAEASSIGQKGDTTGWLHLDAQLSFAQQLVTVTLTRISSNEVIYEGTVPFLTESINVLDYIYCMGGRDNGVISIDNVLVDASVKAGDYVYTDKAVKSNTSYSYKVAAVVDGKTSHLSRPVSVKTHIHVKEVKEIEPMTLVVGTPVAEGQTAAVLLPGTVAVVDENGAEQAATVTWDVTALDLNTVGEYDVYAHVDGFGEPVKALVKVVANELKGIVPLKDIVINIGEALTLPEKVTLEFTNTTTEERAVVWDTTGLDLKKEGTYKLSGTVEGIEAKAEVTVLVKGVSVVSAQDIYVEMQINTANPDQALPESVKARYSDGTEKQAQVTWDTSKLDTSAAGKVDVTGTIEGYEGVVTAHVSVEYPLTTRFDFGISTGSVENGWTGVTVNAKKKTKKASELGIAYTQEKGYGFLNGNAVIEGRSENYTQDGIIPSKVYTDFALPAGQTFAVDVKNGKYEVEVISGSEYNGSMEAVIEGVKLSMGNAVKEYSTERVTVDVTDGQLTIEFSSGFTSRVDAVIIRSVVESETKVDKEELKKAVEAAKKLDKDEYTQTSYEEMMSYVKAAEAVLADDAATQEAVNKALKELNDAVEALEKNPPVIIVDKEELKKAVEAAKKLDKDEYTQSSYEEMMSYVKAAEAVIADDGATQEAVDKALKELNDAVEALEKRGEDPEPPVKVDKEALQKSIADVKALDSSKYTQGSYESLKAVLAAAEAVFADESATQQQVDDAQKALADAVAALVEAGDDNTDDNNGDNSGENNGDDGGNNSNDGDNQGSAGSDSGENKDNSCSDSAGKKSPATYDSSAAIQTQNDSSVSLIWLVVVVAAAILVLAGARVYKMKKEDEE